MPTSGPDPDAFSRQEAANLAALKERIAPEVRRRMTAAPLPYSPAERTSPPVDIAAAREAPSGLLPRCYFCDYIGVYVCGSCAYMVRDATASNPGRAISRLGFCPCRYCGRAVLDGADLCPNCQAAFVP